MVPKGLHLTLSLCHRRGLVVALRPRKWLWLAAWCAFGTTSPSLSFVSSFAAETARYWHREPATFSNNQGEWSSNYYPFVLQHFSSRRRTGRSVAPTNRVDRCVWPRKECTPCVAMRSSSSSSSSTDSLVSLWSERIQAAYNEEETDGIVKLACSSEESPTIDVIPVADLWQATEQAISGNKGQAASILNAWIAACYQHSSTEDAAQYAQALFEAACHGTDNSEASDFTVQPDIVTYSLLFSVLDQNKTTQARAEEVLQEAMKMSKKAAGSKRRRAMAAARRKKAATSTFREAEAAIQNQLGSDFAVLYEDNDLIVVNKPAGVSCFHKHITTAGRRKVRKRKESGKTTQPSSQVDISLEDALLSSGLPMSTLNADARGLVHRLDRGTSGCLVLAKNDATHARLVTDFFLRSIPKTYTCLVSPAPSKDSGMMDSFVNGRPAKSTYNVMERFEKEDGNASAALLNVQTLTGRKHQVRVHCAQGLNCPILGDDMYSNSNRKNNNKKNDPNDCFFLHASSLSIPAIEMIEAPIPGWWKPTMEHWKDTSA